MKTKAKKFSHKLLALFMAVLMAATCFTGVMTSYAASYDTKYADSDIEYNDLAWNVLSDEQVATAILDYADSILPALKEMEPTIADMVNNADVPVISINYNLEKRQITVKFALTTLATITIKLGSVDELLETINSVQDVLDGGLVNTASNLGIDLGFVKDLDLSAVNDMRRSTTSSTDIVRGVLGIIYDNNDAVIGSLLRGEFSTGVIGLDIYQTLADLVGGIDSGYQSNFVYNFVQALLFKYTEWFTDEEILAYKGGGTITQADGTEKTVEAKTFVYDDVLLEKMTVHLLDKINVLVTYPDGTSSESRKAEIDAKMEAGMTYKEAAQSLGYDPNLVYSDENPGNVLLFAYGDDMVQLSAGDSLFSFGYQALKFAWQTVLKDTVKLIHVNNDVDRGHGTNFDNNYYYWASEQLGWDTSDVASNYTIDKVTAWAEAVYESYGAESADEFLGWVKDNYRFDRTVAEDAVGNWRDIDPTTLFNKLRYSPLADYTFDIQTGPINLYFMQTGTPNLDAFFDTYLNDTYSSLVGGFNDCLVAAVKDLFPDRDNIYVDEKGDTARPEMATVNPSGEIDSAAITSITNTLVGNALKVVQYVADTTDQNILNGFYMSNGEGTALSETNLESAMIPLLVSCIGEVNLSGYKLRDMIHPEDWDRCLDAEAVAFIALREYLSYVLPNKDYNTLATITETKITADFNACILPMARDAIIYVIEPYVPVTDASGNQWTAAGDTIDTTTSIFDLLNSVVCYYADNYTFTNSKRSGENALGVASLLGACDANGKSLINMSNTLWENIDIIVNEFFPVIGTLQGKGYGNADSESLIMGDIVNGVLNIGDANAETGMCGVSNFIYRLLTIFSAEPIQTTPVIRTVYDLVKDLLNGLFGPRYSGQEWVPVPDASSDHPWDDVVQKDVIAGPSSGNPGVLGKAINNFVEFSGFGWNGVSTYPDSILPGLLFAVSAVNSFVGILPGIADHKLQMGTVEFTDPTFQGCTSGSSYSSSVTFTNNSTGVNVAYVDGMNDEVDQLSRYYMRVTGARIEGTSSNSTIATPSSELIAPGDSITISTSSYFQPSGDDSSSNYTVTITYDVCDASGNVLYSNLTSNAYQYLTGATSWRENVYSVWHDYEDDRPYEGYYLDGELESNSVDQTLTQTGTGYKAYTTSYFAATSTSVNRLSVGYPEYIVLSTDNLSLVDQLGVRIRNIRWGLSSTERSVDGIYYYDEGTYYDDNTGANVTIGSANAVPVYDKITGDVIKYGLYDISYDNGDTWDNNSGAGYTQDEVNTKLSEVAQESVNDFRSRTHVAYTFSELLSNSAIAAYHVNEKTGQYEYIYLKNASGSYAYDTLLGNISVRGPIEGFYFNPTKYTIPANTSLYFHFLNYDGFTDVSNVNITSNVCFYNSTKSATAPLKFVICDTENASAVSDKLDELQTLMAQYKTSDFVDGDTVYTTAHDAIISALSATALPITPTTAAQLADNTELKLTTATSASATGDKAYKPLTDDAYQALSDDVKALIYYNSDNEHYYFDSQYMRPVYSTDVLTADDVTDGKDAVGMPVTAITDGDGNTNYYITNSVQYAREWDTTTYNTDGVNYPWYGPTSEQATNSAGDLLYDQVQWSYYNKNGDKVSSNSTWVIKMPDTSYQIVENTGEEGSTDNRGIYTKNNDRLEYVIQYVKDSIDQTVAQTLLSDVSEVRDGLNETNFEIVTYNKMVSMAKTIESKYTIEVTYERLETQYDENGDAVLDEEGNAVKEPVEYSGTTNFAGFNEIAADPDVTIVSKAVESTLSSTQIAEYIRLFNIFLGAVVERGYLGDRLEEEIPCASGNVYSALVVDGITTVTPEDGDPYKDYSTATVSKTSAATTPAFGTFNSDGLLVNDGDVVYPSNLWANYVSALARAVDLAQLGNGDYAHKDEALFVATADDYEARVTSVYDAKIDLQAAEIALEDTSVLTINVPEGCSVIVNNDAYTKPIALTTDEYVTITATPAEGYEFTGFQVGEEVIADNPYSFKLERDTTVTALVEASAPTGFNVSGTIVLAQDVKGTHDKNILAYGEYTIDVYSDSARTELVTSVTSTCADGVNSFVIENLADGTYYATVTSTYSIALENITIVVSGAEITDAVIPVVGCDMNKDGTISAEDAKVVYKAASSGALKEYCDINGDGIVSAEDVKVVLKFAAGSNLPALAIQ
ncbi:MAG: dockerin type I domain-containing protein [Eubacterium sp.]